MKDSLIQSACVALVLIAATGCCLVESQRGFTKVDIGGCRLSMLIVGRGSPVVILESGAGDAIGVWELVQPKVAEFTTVVAYSRAGLGLSDPAPKEARASAQIAYELHTALHRAGLKPPYVLVGHSVGGFHIRLFAHQFPGEVAGLVLVDPSSEDWDEIMRTRFPAKYKEFLDWRARPHPEGMRKQLEGWEVSKEQARAAWPLPDVPVVLLSGIKGKSDGSETEYYAEWRKVHEVWLGKIPHGIHVLACQSGHYIQFSEPELVVSAISNIVASARSQGSDRSGVKTRSKESKG